MLVQSASKATGSGVIEIGWWEFETMETLRGQIVDILNRKNGSAVENGPGGGHTAPFRDDGDD